MNIMKNLTILFFLSCGFISSSYAELSGLSDEFDDISSLNNFRVFDEANLGSLLRLVEVSNGRLVLEVGENHRAWFQTLTGAAYTKDIDGDFIVEVDVRTLNKNNLSESPQSTFNATEITQDRYFTLFKVRNHWNF